MKVLKNINVLKKAISAISDLGFVPTMGGLHKGHISLIKESQKKCKKTLVSIYVNPKQFDNKNDFSNPANPNSFASRKIGTTNPCGVPTATPIS